MKTIRRERDLAPSVKASGGWRDRPRRPMITCEDRRKLGSLVTYERRRLEPQAGALDARLDDALYVERDEIPATVVTMDSTVELVNLRTNECFLATLVYPDEAEFFDDSISVLEPLGLALLGSSAGSVIQCRGDRGTASFKVLSIIHQPEQELARR
jgi:regulator of nucleoside diphosphate kinase